mmetsp:Transcript_112151/g.322391  ORF Transcript_112151/g.322391 Transcript_112151/m.322391 type:complete len:201 (+) Transcript_112151:1858-2460(+)
MEAWKPRTFWKYQLACERSSKVMCNLLDNCWLWLTSLNILKSPAKCALCAFTSKSRSDMKRCAPSGFSIAKSCLAPASRSSDSPLSPTKPTKPISRQSFTNCASSHRPLPPASTPFIQASIMLPYSAVHFSRNSLSAASALGSRSPSTRKPLSCTSSCRQMLWRSPWRGNWFHTLVNSPKVILPVSSTSSNRRHVLNNDP